MNFTYETSYELANYFGMNWNKDPQWHQAWFDNFAGLLFASFQNYDNELVRRAVMQYITDSTDKKIPPFGELRSFIVKKLGAEQMRQAIQASSCHLCLDGTRRLFIVAQIDEDEIIKREYVARCTCSRGALNSKVCSYTKFIDLLHTSKAYNCLGFADSDPHCVKLLEWHVTSYSKHSGRDEYPAGVDPSPFAGLSFGEIEQVMKERKDKMRANGIKAKRRQFRECIVANKNSQYLN
tara:strand:+ start:1078 stop:1788 length:711 start_codon:yes stop_codon:yes gene_type:complete